MTLLNVENGHNPVKNLWSKTQNLNKNLALPSETESFQKNIYKPVAEAEDSAHKQDVFARSALSEETHSSLLPQQDISESNSSNRYLSIYTDTGKTKLDLDEYFSNTPSNSPENLSDVTLLTPSLENIQGIKQHVSARLDQTLAQYNIPEAPAEITYNNHGEMQLPEDYAYAEEFRQMLEENPGLKRELKTLYSLTSHYVEIRKLDPFHEEFAAAETQAEINAVIEKYRHLLFDNRQENDIALAFSKDGLLTLLVDGAPLEEEKFIEDPDNLKAEG